MTNVLSPVGRFVQGDCFKGQTTNQKGEPLIVKSGPNKGMPRTEYYVGVAFSKTDPAWPAFRAQLDEIAKTGFPNLFPAVGGQFPGAGGGALLSTHPQFAWKIIDGDGYDQTGRSNAEKEGFRGHWVVRFNSGYPPKVYPVGRHSPLDQLTDPSLVRRGYYIRVFSNVSLNTDVQKPGLFLNVGLVELVATGPEIRGGVDAADAFSTPVVLPPGAEALPGSAPVAPVAAPAYVPPVAPVAPVAPAPVVAPVPVPPAPVPAAPVRIMTPKANGLTYEQYIGAGWTEEMMIANGILAV